MRSRSSIRKFQAFLQACEYFLVGLPDLCTQLVLPQVTPRRSPSGSVPVSMAATTAVKWALALSVVCPADASQRHRRSPPRSNLGLPEGLSSFRCSVIPSALRCCHDHGGTAPWLGRWHQRCRPNHGGFAHHQRSKADWRPNVAVGSLSDPLEPRPGTRSRSASQRWFEAAPLSPGW